MRRIQEPSYWWILSLMFLILPKHKACHPGKYSPTRYGATTHTDSSLECLSPLNNGKSEFGCVFPFSWNPEPGFRSRVHGHTLTSMLRSGAGVEPFRRDCIDEGAGLWRTPPPVPADWSQLWTRCSRVTPTC